MSTIRTRREPPRFRAVEVVRVARRSPRMVRVTLAGDELAGLDPGLPAASVRLLLPAPSAHEVVVPVWNGNEFLLADGSRPTLRTLTPLRFDAVRNELDVEIVLHGDGPLSSWASTVEPGNRAAVSGTGRGYEIDPSALDFLLAGDESALPAISVLLPALPPTAEVRVLVEIGDPAARLELPDHPSVTVDWCVLPVDAHQGDALTAAVSAAPCTPATRVWAAGEAAAMQRIRRHLSETAELPRTQAVVRGYWKHGRRSDDAAP